MQHQNLKIYVIDLIVKLLNEVNELVKAQIQTLLRYQIIGNCYKLKNFQIFQHVIVINHRIRSIIVIKIVSELFFVNFFSRNIR